MEKVVPYFHGYPEVASKHSPPTLLFISEGYLRKNFGTLNHPTRLLRGFGGGKGRGVHMCLPFVRTDSPS